MFYVYLAQCADESLYTGYCKDIAKREAEHNAGTGAKYTRSRRPVTIVYHEEHPSKSAALKREAEVKKWTRAQKLELAESKK